MKRFRNFLRQYRRKIVENSILSSNPIDELFDQRRKCTCHLFELKIDENSRKISRKENFPLDEFCFWFDIRTTLKDLVDRVVKNENENELMKKISSTVVRQSSHSNCSKRKRKRKQISVAIQTSPIDEKERRRNAKIQTNSFVLQRHFRTDHLISKIDQGISSSERFSSEKIFDRS